jgi:hypothetical protein
MSRAPLGHAAFQHPSTARRGRSPKTATGTTSTRGAAETSATNLLHNRAAALLHQFPTFAPAASLHVHEPELASVGQSSAFAAMLGASVRHTTGDVTRSAHNGRHRDTTGDPGRSLRLMVPTRVSSVTSSLATRLAAPPTRRPPGNQQSNPSLQRAVALQIDGVRLDVAVPPRPPPPEADVALPVLYRPEPQF